MLLPTTASSMAYPAPWWLDRSLSPPWYRLEHRGFETAEAVTVSLLGSGSLLSVVPGRIHPGQGIRFAARDGLARDSVLIVRWLTPNEVEYLWRASF